MFIFFTAAPSQGNAALGSVLSLEPQNSILDWFNSFVANIKKCKALATKIIPSYDLYICDRRWYFLVLEELGEFKLYPQRE
ncbi:MAG: hypothetical protein F6J93_20500 [Oscillatoria sp. SIO1A7]|nr:hypothetical protein [Oscillatoria sp. SIO1A7]